MKIGPFVILFKSKKYPKLKKFINAADHVHKNPVKRKIIDEDKVAAMPRSLPRLGPVEIVTSDGLTQGQAGHDFGGQI